MIVDAAPSAGLKIIFAIKAMSHAGGGAERVLADVASALARFGHDVSVISFEPEGTSDFFTLDPAVNRVRLGIGITHRRSTASETLRRLTALRRTVVGQDPDVAVGFMHSMYLPLGLALVGTGIPVIGSDHIVHTHFKSRPLEAALLRASPLLCRAITAVSTSARASYPSWIQKKMVVVPNPVSAPSHGRADPVGGEAKTLLCIGRLAEQKDHATLIAAFARIAAQFPDWNLRIIGEGKLRCQLTAQIDALGMKERIHLPGPVSNVGDELRRAQLFVLPSVYESFGLVTAEALAYGLPVVGFADCPGTNELVIPGVNGLLVAGSNRVEALANGLRTLMEDARERSRLSISAPKTVGTFAPEEVAGLWEQLIRQTINHPKSSGN